MSFSVLGVDHVSVTTPQELEGDVVAWYGDCLGLERLDKPEGTRPEGAWFGAGQQQLHVSIDEHNPHKAAHVGLVVDDFNAVVASLRSAGCHLEQASEIPGRRRCFARDPAGNLLEILSFDSDIERAGQEGRS